MTGMYCEREIKHGMGLRWRVQVPPILASTGTLQVQVHVQVYRMLFVTTPVLVVGVEHEVDFLAKTYFF